MKLKYLFVYLSYGALAAFFSFVQKVFAALSKKCSALMHGAERLLESTRRKIDGLKNARLAADETLLEAFPLA